MIIPPPQPLAVCPRPVTSRLYRALKRNTTCRCDPIPGSHVGYLELHCGPHSEQDGSFHFTTVFRPAAAHQLAHWQLLRFHVPRARKRVRFEKDCSEAQTTSSPVQPPAGFIQVDNQKFCELLEKRWGPILWNFQVDEDDALLVRSTPVQADRFLTAAPHLLTLSEALETRELSDDAKLLLAHTIAYSVWQFYDSEDISVRWSSKAIFFCRQRSTLSQPESGMEYDPLKPLIDMALDDLKRLESEIQQEFVHGHFGVIPCAPRILALGVLLKNILGPHPQRATLDTQASWEAELNSELFECSQVAKDHLWPDLSMKSEMLYEHLRLAVSACADHASFGNADLSMSDRKALLYDKVVWPLRCISQYISLDQSTATWTLRESSKAENNQIATGGASVQASSSFSGITASDSTRLHAGHVYNNVFLGEGLVANNSKLLGSLKIKGVDDDSVD